MYLDTFFGHPTLSQGDASAASKLGNYPSATASEKDEYASATAPERDDSMNSPWQPPSSGGSSSNAVKPLLVGGSSSASPAGKQGDEVVKAEMGKSMRAAHERVHGEVEDY